MIPDVEAFLAAELEPYGDVTGDRPHPQDACITVSRIDTLPTDVPTYLDVPVVAIDVWGGTGESKASVYTRASQIYDVVFDLAGANRSGVVVYRVTQTQGLRLLPDESGRYRYGFAVSIGDHAA